MDGGGDEMAHEDIWDDSALITSWNEALAEYKKYHSLHATGGKLEDLPEHNNGGGNAKPETGGVFQDTKVQEVSDQQHEGIEVVDDASAKQQKEHIGSGGIADARENLDGSTGTSAGAAASGMPPPPQLLLGSVQDESLKRLLMSWYYAGYYTGLYEGQQKHQRPAQ